MSPVLRPADGHPLPIAGSVRDLSLWTCPRTCVGPWRGHGPALNPCGDTQGGCSSRHLPREDMVHPTRQGPEGIRRPWWPWPASPGAFPTAPHGLRSFHKHPGWGLQSLHKQHCSCAWLWSHHGPF